MEPYKEEEIKSDSPFPVDIFIRDNSKEHVVAPPHWHDCFEILYMLEGSADQQVNDKFFKIEKHDIVIIKQGDIHSTYCIPGDPVRILVVKFLPDLISNSYSKEFESKYILAFLNKQSDTPCHLVDTLKTSTEVYNLMMGLYREFEKRKTGYEIYIKGYIYQLIACLIRSGIINVQYLRDKENELGRLDTLFKYVEANYKENIDLKKAADILNMSYYYFSRYFKKVTGHTFKEYINFVRICEAEKLISTHKMNISQAAYEVGFCNVSSFNRVFRRIRNYSPRNILRAKTAKF